MTDEHPAFTANHRAARYPMPQWYEAVVAALTSKSASARGTVYTAPANTPIPTGVGPMPGFVEIGTLADFADRPAAAPYRWSGIVGAGEQEHAAVVHFDATGFARDVWLALMTPPRRRGLETRSARHRRNRLRRKRAARKRNR